MKNENQAGHYYCKAIEKSPMEYEAHFNLAVLLNDMKDYKGASEEFKKAGLLLDSAGDSPKTNYIYSILSEVNQKIAINSDDDYFKKLKEDEERNDVSKYKAGKLVIDYNDDKNNEFIKSFKKCSGYEIFIVRPSLIRNRFQTHFVHRISSFLEYQPHRYTNPF